LDKVTAHALTGMGLAEEKLERRDQALAHFMEALGLYRKLSDRDNEATILYNLGNLHDTSGELDEAARRYGEALDLDIAVGDLRGAADCRAALASIEVVRGNPEQAVALLREATDFYRSGGYRRRAINSLVDLAVIARDDERFAEGEAFLGDALQLAVQLTDPVEIHDVQLHWGDLCFKSGDVAGARNRYEQAAEAMERARQMLLRESDALSYFGEDRVECIDRLVILTAAADPRACAEWVERAKGQELIRRLASVPLPPPRGTPARVLFAQEQAAEEVHRLSAQLADETAATPALLSAYADAHHRLRSAAAAVAEFDPEWAALRVGDAPSWADLADLLARLSSTGLHRDVVFVHYYMRETATAVMGLRPGRDPELVPVDVPLADLRSVPAAPRDRSWSQTEQTLSRLIAPIAAWAAPGDRILLCPHDALHRVPLHAAEIEGQPLGERNVVTYTPSAAVLRYCMAKRHDDGAGALMLADASVDKPLVFARDQMLALTDLFRAYQTEFTCYTREAATLAAITNSLQEAGAPAFLHFAVHGFTDPSTGLESGIQLADGPLTARRVLGLRLPCQLACMGACDTGVSERRAGDELLGLIRSMIYAGSASVMATLWPVDQLSSAMLMIKFYRNVLTGTSKADALHEAQLWLRKTTAAEAMAYLSAARLRAGDDPRAQVAIGLAEAQVQLCARDPRPALKIAAKTLERADLTNAEARAAANLRGLALLSERAEGSPDYSRRPFSHPQHWAPFILIGDSN
jgi:CHAT domain-containing protein